MGIANRFITKRSVFDFLASGFYSGYAPIVPGTFGTVVGLLLAIINASINPYHFVFLNSLVLAIALTIFAIGIVNRALSNNIYVTTDKARKGAAKIDPSQIVIDEIAGFFFAICGLEHTMQNLVGAFVLFRIFDIIKPPPIKALEKLPGPFGIVMDDVLAGVYANVTWRLLVVVAG